LEYYRVLNLAEGGMGVAEAKKQAQKEILAAFGIDADGFKDSEDMSIFGSSESDAALLAISILLQGDLSEGEFSQRLTSFSQAIRDGGTPSDEVMEAMADWALPRSFKNEMIEYNILAWGLSDEVPDFKKYIDAYWTSKYEVGVCNEERYGYMKEFPDKELYYGFPLALICIDHGILGIIWQPINYNREDILCLRSGICEGLLIDARDSNKYRTATIEDENITWMVDALKYTDNGNIDIYYDHQRAWGSSYTWEQALAACPVGWRLPNDQDTEAIVSFFNSNLDKWNYSYGFSSWANDESSVEIVQYGLENYNVYKYTRAELDGELASVFMFKFIHCVKDKTI